MKLKTLTKYLYDNAMQYRKVKFLKHLDIQPDRTGKDCLVLDMKTLQYMCINSDKLHEIPEFEEGVIYKFKSYEHYESNIVVYVKNDVKEKFYDLRNESFNDKELFENLIPIKIGVYSDYKKLKDKLNTKEGD